MIRFFSSILIVCLTGHYVYGQAQADSFRVHIKLIDPDNLINDGVRIEINSVDISMPERRSVLAESVFIGDTAVLTGHVPQPIVSMMSITIDSPRRSFRSYKILLENTDYHVTLTWMSNSKLNVVTDSRFHNTWHQWVSTKNEFDIEKGRWISEHSHSIRSGRQHEADSLLRLIDGIEHRKILFEKAFGYQNPDNQATAYILGGGHRIYDADHLAIYEALTNEVKNSYYGRAWKAKLDMMGETPAELSPAIDTKSPLLGQVLPGFQGWTNMGDTVVIDQAYFISNPQNKITLIEFWASWCTPCRIANMNLYPLYFKYKDQGFQVISFSLDTNEEQWLAAQQKDNLPWLDISDLKGPRSPVPPAYNIWAIPTNVLVDAHGTVIAVNVYDSEVLEKLLDK